VNGHPEKEGHKSVDGGDCGHDFLDVMLCSLVVLSKIAEEHYDIMKGKTQQFPLCSVHKVLLTGNCNNFSHFFDFTGFP
jgi:hypothetical protein